MNVFYVILENLEEMPGLQFYFVCINQYSDIRHAALS